MDKLLLRIRIAALDAAVQMRSTNADTTVSMAEHFEAWLTRPAPVDQPPESHAVETTAGRLGYEYCQTGWKNTANLRDPHACRHSPGHAPPHRCACGSECDMP